MDTIEDFFRLLPTVKEKEFYVWGTGNTAQLYQEGYNREDINIVSYIDSNTDKQGDVFCGKPIIMPEAYMRKKDLPILINTAQKRAFGEISDQILKWGGCGFNPDAIIFSWHKDEIREVYESLDDKRSKEIYLNALTMRMTWDAPDEKYVTDDQYFAMKEYRIRRPWDVFVDCGAYVGDSIEQYIWKMDGVFRKIIGFEPDSNNFRAALKRVERLKSEWNVPKDGIEIYPYGIGDTNIEMQMETNEDNNGLGSKVVGEADNRTEKQGMKISVISLDSFFRNRNDDVSFLKADIESFEYKMLLGAKELIKKHCPRLAICIYHNPTDMYSIPILVRRINPYYKLFIRQHSYNLDETVLYAYED
ncbi:MAG: FkbM family methyltransferase [Lachnospiraceae bacterium]|nr:FkbM family methyltransferase [Lachnospiraceae bacterium]